MCFLQHQSTQIHSIWCSVKVFKVSSLLGQICLNSPCLPGVQGQRRLAPSHCAEQLPEQHLSTTPRKSRHLSTSLNISQHFSTFSLGFKVLKCTVMCSPWSCTVTRPWSLRKASETNSSAAESLCTAAIAMSRSARRRGLANSRLQPSQSRSEKTRKCESAKRKHTFHLGNWEMNPSFGIHDIHVTFSP